MSLCTDPSYTCGEYETREVSSNSSISISHIKNRISTLLIGTSNIILNKRVRNYLYTQQQTEQKSNYKLVLDVGDMVYIDCYDIHGTNVASISDNYQAIDSTIKYVDLRNDIIIYEKTDVTMKYKDPSNTTLVNVRTNYDDAHLHPFIFENVPITGSKQLIYNNSGVEEILHEEVINSGYWDGIRILMPQFDGGDPYGIFTYNGVTYDAKEVDWYFLLAHMEADGGLDLYWPDWLKAVGVYNDLDSKEAVNRWQAIIGKLPTPATLSSDSEIHTTNLFTGSVAVGINGDIFLSIQFPKDSTNPSGLKEYKNTIYGTDQTLSEIFNPIGETYFPVAPL